LLKCLQNHPEEPILQCAASQACAQPQAQQWTLWARQVKNARGQPTPDASWQPVVTECRLTTPPDIPTPRPQVTDALVCCKRCDASAFHGFRSGCNPPTRRW
jgi:hypothetical protein